MGSLSEELVTHTDAIVQRWYEAWKQNPQLSQEVGEAKLKDNLPEQLRIIGEQLRELADAEDPEHMWKITDRLDPELRVEQDVPIEEIVQEYRLAVDTVRSWIQERGIQVPFQESSYFYSAIFELTAEAVRRYAAHQAEQVSAGRAQYLASVMHQLRTPVSVLSMQVERMEASERIDAAVLARLLRNVRRVRVLVDGILRLERYQPWEVPVNLEPTRPLELARNIVGDYESEARRKGLAVEIRIDPALELDLDPDLFVDALGNLVHNAVKYTREGSVVLEADAGDEEVVFRVCDSGPGIPEEERRELFRAPRPGHAGGAGIGLLIAQHAAQALGGRIEVETEVGRGSTFSLWIPRCPQQS